MSSLKTLGQWTLGLAIAGSLMLAGCDKDRERKQMSGQMGLKPEQKVSKEMAGWVALPARIPPEVKTDAAQNVSYAVLNTSQVVPGSLDGWVAMKPQLFAKMSGIQPEAPPQGEMERYYLGQKGDRIPSDKAGWTILPPTEPVIEASSSKKNLAMATLRAENIIPSAMNGWVAVNRDTLSALTEKYMMSQSK